MTTIEELTQKIKSGDCIIDKGCDDTFSLVEHWEQEYTGVKAYHEITRVLYDANREFFNKEGFYDKDFNERGELR